MGWKKYYVEGLNQTFRKAKTARAAAQRSANITGENHRIWIETAATGTMQVAIISPDKQSPDKQNPGRAISLKNFTGRVIKKGNQVFIEGRGKRD